VVGHQEWECELCVYLFCAATHSLTLTLFFSIHRPNGVRFVAPAGTKEFSNRWNPKVGDIVTFKHRGFLLGNNKPKFPTLYRLRDDMGWEDVVQNWKEHKTKPLGTPLYPPHPPHLGLTQTQQLFRVVDFEGEFNI